MTGLPRYFRRDTIRALNRESLDLFAAQRCGDDGSTAALDLLVGHLRPDAARVDGVQPRVHGATNQKRKAPTPRGAGRLLHGKHLPDRPRPCEAVS